MKAVILAGGLPSIVEDRYEPIPKPMAEIGGRPILWHIMKNYAYYGIKDFIICTGYKGEYIKDYFMNYYVYESDITVDLQSNNIEIHNKRTEDWKVSLVDTGYESSIAQRLLKIQDMLEEQDFLVTYGDCVSDINVKELVQQHIKGNKITTMAVAMPTGRNKILPIGNETARESDKEFARTDACTMVFNKKIFPYLSIYKQDDVMSDELLGCLMKDEQIQFFFHNGFWSPMETARDKKRLEELYENGNAPWKVW